MNDIQIFNNSEFGSVRTLFINEVTWFCGKDVAEALGYINSNKTITDHCKGDGVTNRYLTDSLGRQQEAKFINEPNLYRLILRSKLPSAERFERWVFEEVLPAIRKNGSYSMSPTRHLTTDDYLNASRIIATAKKETLPYVLFFLERAGLETDKIMQMPRLQYHCADNINESVVDYLQSHDVIGRCSGDVYREYVSYCMEKDVQPVNNITFSKQVNNKLGTQTICRKVNRMNRRVFV